MKPTGRILVARPSLSKTTGVRGKKPIKRRGKETYTLEKKKYYFHSKSARKKRISAGDTILINDRKEGKKPYWVKKKEGTNDKRKVWGEKIFDMTIRPLQQSDQGRKNHLFHELSAGEEGKDAEPWSRKFLPKLSYTENLASLVGGARSGASGGERVAIRMGQGGMTTGETFPRLCHARFTVKHSAGNRTHKKSGERKRRSTKKEDNGRHFPARQRIFYYAALESLYKKKKE